MEKIRTYILSNENAIPYIEFTLKQKEPKINDTEYLYTIDKSNSQNIIKSKKLSTGTILITIINLYDKIMKVLLECKEMIYESEKIRDGDYRDSIRESKRRLLDINKTLNIITNYIDCFYLDVTVNHTIELQNVHSELYIAEHFWNSLEDPQHQQYYRILKKKFEYMSNAQFIKDRCVEFFDNLISEFEKMKNIVDTSFVYTPRENSKTKIFSGTDLILPTPTIYFLNEYSKHSTPIKYVYKLQNITEFFNCSIYHIYLSGKVIAKCKGCNKYFIPNRTNQIYCNAECRELKEERNADKREKRYSQNSYIFYNNIRTRLNRSPKKYEEEVKNFKENYNYADKKKELEELYKKDSTINIELELLKTYTKFDKYLQEKYPSHKKCETSKYWIE